MLATVLIAVVALIHLYILVLEMFLWNTKTGHKAFNLRPDFARDTRVLAANQGLYNGFLAAVCSGASGSAKTGFRWPSSS
jgi:putative membrane protein